MAKIIHINDIAISMESKCYHFCHFVLLLLRVKDMKKEMTAYQQFPGNRLWVVVEVVVGGVQFRPGRRVKR